MRRDPKRASEAGFTLVELMITIVILAILAAAAVYAYTRHIHKTRVVEAHHMLGQIQSLQEGYRETEGQYCYASGALGTFHPSLDAGNEPIAKDWLTGLPADWSCLPVKVPGNKTYFVYSVVAGGPAIATGAPADNFDYPSGIPSHVSLPTAPTAPAHPDPWYYAVARGDLDGDNSVFMELSVSSYRRAVVVVNDGS